MADSLKLNPLQRRDRQPATTTQLGDQPVVGAAEDGLGRDAVALAALFFIIVIHHIQNPLLQFEVDFGRAFRNVTLQPALTIGLIITSLILINLPALMRPGSPTRNPIQLSAAFVLGMYTLYAALAVIVRFNIIGAGLGIEQAAFLDRVRGDDLIPAFERALQLSTPIAVLAFVAVFVLWTPWLRLGTYARALRANAPSLLVGVGVLVAWEALIVVLNIQQFLLPRPSVIASTFLEVYSSGLISVGWNTFQNAFWGFVVGCGLGILTGLISARFASFSRALLPLAIAANSVPIIAFAPIMNNWFGALNPSSKIAIVAILTYFPAMISTVKGLTSVHPLSLELMRSYAASDWAIFRKLRFPTALPFIFSSLKVATTLSMIGAIVSEYFGGSTQGLGYRIREDAALFKYPESWAAIIIASLLGILFYLLVSGVERVVMPWHVSFREE